MQTEHLTNEFVAWQRYSIHGLAGGLFSSNTASWARNDDEDWRVKLSIQWISIRRKTYSLKLVETNGMIFPYTPTVIFSHSAAYSQIKPTHSNYPFPIYRAVNRQLVNYWRILYRRCRRRALLGSLCTLFEINY